MTFPSALRDLFIHNIIPDLDDRSTAAFACTCKQGQELADDSRAFQNEQAMKALSDQISKLGFGKKFILLAEEKIIDPKKLIVHAENSERFRAASILLSQSIFNHVDGTPWDSVRTPEARRTRLGYLSAAEKAGIQRLVTDITKPSSENPLSSTRRYTTISSKYAKDCYGLLQKDLRIQSSPF
jgi:hypothetical protein